MSLGESIVAGWRVSWQMAGSVVGVLGGLLRGTVSVKTLGGPIAIGAASVQAARAGWESLFLLIAFLAYNIFHAFFALNLKPQIRMGRTQVFWARLMAAEILAEVNPSSQRFRNETF